MGQISQCVFFGLDCPTLGSGVILALVRPEVLARWHVGHFLRNYERLLIMWPPIVF